MFGRRADRRHEDDSEVEVEVHLEQDIQTVQEATDAFLSNPDEPHRQQLLAALETLDDLTEASDAYEARVVSAAFGLSRTVVLGETDAHPVAEDLRASVLRSQADLVKAAKAAVTSPGPSGLEELRAASSKLASLQAPPDPADGVDES
jgi:hypothetical protein